MRLAILYSPYYKDVTDALREGVLDEVNAFNKNVDSRDSGLRGHFLHKITCHEFSVVGALELPLALKYICKSQKFDMAIVMGCVVRGETSHYDVVVNETMRKIMDIGIEYSFPVGNAILTVENLKQAMERASIDKKNKGADAFAACMSLLALKDSIQ